MLQVILRIHTVRTLYMLQFLLISGYMVYMKSTRQPLTPPCDIEEERKLKSSDTQKLINERLEKYFQKSINEFIQRSVYLEGHVQTSVRADTCLASQLSECEISQ